MNLDMQWFECDSAEKINSDTYSSVDYDAPRIMKYSFTLANLLRKASKGLRDPGVERGHQEGSLIALQERADSCGSLSE